jgi:uncharacterized membrane protein HdeD (DUF308 family)
MYNHFVFGIVIIISGIMMIIGSMRSKSQSTKWAARSFMTAGVGGIVLGILVFCLFFGAAYFSSITITLLDHYKTLLTGFEVGIIVTLAIGGQLKISQRKKKSEDNL